MMTFKLHFKKVTKQGTIKTKFDRDKLKDLKVSSIFDTQVGRHTSQYCYDSVMRTALQASAEVLTSSNQARKGC